MLHTVQYSNKKNILKIKNIDDQQLKYENGKLKIVAAQQRKLKAEADSPRRWEDSCPSSEITPRPFGTSKSPKRAFRPPNTKTSSPRRKENCATPNDRNGPRPFRRISSEIRGSSWIFPTLPSGRNVRRGRGSAFVVSDGQWGAIEFAIRRSPTFRFSRESSVRNDRTASRAMNAGRREGSGVLEKGGGPRGGRRRRPVLLRGGLAFAHLGRDSKQKNAYEPRKSTERNLLDPREKRRTSSTERRRYATVSRSLTDTTILTTTTTETRRRRSRKTSWPTERPNRATRPSRRWQPAFAREVLIYINRG